MWVDRKPKYTAEIEQWRTDAVKEQAKLSLEVSDGAITNRLLPELKEWQQRPLDAVYPFVWLDAVHYKIKDESRYVNKAVHTVLGLNTDGHKELLG